jgi:hypothetical protein
MLIDGVIFEAECPSPPRAGGVHRTVIAASRSGSAGTQVAASAGRLRGTASPKVIGRRTIAAVSETRSSSRRQLSARSRLVLPGRAGLGLSARFVWCRRGTAVDAPNQLLQPTLDPVACPLPRPVAGIKRG